MIIVHETFICKPGNASKLAQLFKEVMGSYDDFVHVLTDITGEFNRVIIVSKFENLSAFEDRFQKYAQNTEEAQKMKEKMQGYHEMYLSGTREVFQVW